jgi:hypothetical protein
MGRNAETLGGVPIEATNKNQETAKKSVEQSLFEVEKTLPLMDSVRVLEAVQVRNFMQRVQIGSTARSSETQLEGAGRRILGETTALESRTIENNWADLTGITGTGNRSMGTSDRSGEILRAERLDQVFRRDSRRYDGGFFLY